jgi:hypothetical protein
MTLVAALLLILGAAAAEVPKVRVGSVIEAVDTSLA